MDEAIVEKVRLAIVNALGCPTEDRKPLSLCTDPAIGCDCHCRTAARAALSAAIRSLTEKQNGA